MSVNMSPHIDWLGYKRQPKLKPGLRVYNYLAILEDGTILQFFAHNGTQWRELGFKQSKGSTDPYNPGFLEYNGHRESAQYDRQLPKRAVKFGIMEVPLSQVPRKFYDPAYKDGSTAKI